MQMYIKYPIEMWPILCTHVYLEDDVHVYICIDAYDILGHPGTILGSPGHASTSFFLLLLYLTSSYVTFIPLPISGSREEW